jgi:hypothetical protein
MSLNSPKGERYQPQIVPMQQVARETWEVYERRLVQAQVPAPQRPDYHKWTRFYFDFCQKYAHPPRSLTSLGPFLIREYQAPELLLQNPGGLPSLGGEVSNFCWQPSDRPTRRG